jgi:hypothetical protein
MDMFGNIRRAKELRAKRADKRRLSGELTLFWVSWWTPTPDVLPSAPYLYWISGNREFSVGQEEIAICAAISASSKDEVLRDIAKRFVVSESRFCSERDVASFSLPKRFPGFDLARTYLRYCQRCDNRGKILSRGHLFIACPECEKSTSPDSPSPTPPSASAICNLQSEICDHPQPPPPPAATQPRPSTPSQEPPK